MSQPHTCQNLNRFGPCEACKVEAVAAMRPADLSRCCLYKDGEFLRFEDRGSSFMEASIQPALGPYPRAMRSWDAEAVKNFAVWWDRMIDMGWEAVPRYVYPDEAAKAA